ncbi:MAG: hypothetical protein R6U98_11700 [Pirellulaceae bacterium]
MNGEPPWEAEWAFGKLPPINVKLPSGENFAWVMRGDSENGELLALDLDTSTVWLFGWDW